MKKNLITSISLFIIVLLSGCPSPLSESRLAVYQDLVPPELIITSPADYCEYSTVLLLEGSLNDPSILSASEDTLLTVSYNISGTSISGTTEINIADGSFSETIDVSSLSGDKTIEVSAADLNGNIATVFINIIKPDSGGDISGFAITPGNKELCIEWAPVPYAESYTLLQTSNGIARSGVQSPCIWTDLENGEVYNFILTAHVPDSVGDDAVSAELSGMPLSAYTFKPWVNSVDYHSITLEWHDSPNVPRYTVERSLNANGPWEIVQSKTLNIITDDRAEPGVDYFYRVIPSNADAGSIIPTRASAGMFNTEIQYRAISGGASTTGIDVSGDYAYLADQSGKLIAVDISDPLAPGEISYSEYSSFNQDICIYEEHAYVISIGGYGSDLIIFDVSAPLNPGSPVAGPVSLTGTATSANRIKVCENPVDGRIFAYIASGSSGLAIVDVTNPLQPGSAVFKDTTDKALDVFIEYPYAYVTDRNDGLAIIDITDPDSPADDTAPAYKSFYNAGSGPAATGVTIKNGKAYIAAMLGGLIITDVSDPESDETITAADYISLGSGSYANDIVIDGSWAYITDPVNDELIMVDVSDPDSPCAPIRKPVSGGPSAVVVSGSRVFMAAGTDCLAVADTAHPFNWSTPKQVSVTNWPKRLTVYGSYAYMADQGAGVAVVDISNPASPSVKGYIEADNDYSWDTAVSGNYLFIADYNNGLGIADISDPLNPGEPDFLPLSDDARTVTVAGDYAFVSLGTSGLDIIDISDPENPGEPVNIDTSGFASDVEISGGYAFLADGTNGLTSIDISDPGSPRIIDSASTTGAGGGSALALDIAGNYAYVAAGAGGLVIMDISDPARPENACYKASTDPVTGITVTDSYAFVTLGPGETAIIDISDKSTDITDDTVHAYMSTPGEAQDIYIADNYAYISESGPNSLTAVRLWHE